MPNNLHRFDPPKHGPDYSFSSKVVRIPRATPPNDPATDWPAWGNRMLAKEKRDERIHAAIFWSLMFGAFVLGALSEWTFGQ